VNMLPLYFAVCLSVAGLGAVIPLLPFYATHFGAGADTAPLVFSIFSGAGLLAAPAWGRLSDHIGRKPVLLASVAITILSYLWLANAQSLWEVFASRALAGAAAGWLAAAQAFVADSTPKADRAKGLGFLGAAIGLGFVIGPSMGGYAVGGEDPNYMLPSIFAGTFATLSLLTTAIFVKEPARRESRSRPMFGFGLLANRLILRLFAIHLGVYLVFTALEGTFPLWCEAALNLGPRDVAWYMTFIGVVLVIVQGGLVGRMTKRYGEARLLCVGIALIGLGLFGMAFTTDAWWALLPLGAISVGFGFHNPAAQSLISRASPIDLQGGALGGAQSIASLGRIFGPAWGGAVFVSMGYDWPYLIGAIFLIPILGLTLPLLRRADA